VLEAGKAAEALTHSQIAGKPFTVVTCWQDAKGASRLPRYYAFVLYGSNDEHDLASTLAQNGMVRIYGMPAEPPGPMSGSQFHDSLLKLAASAKAKHLGVYGNLTSEGAANTGLNAGAVSAGGGTRPATGSSAPLSFLFPAKSRAPEVVENPADDIISDFAIESMQTGTITQGGISEDNFSEIPGWKPSGKKKKPDAAGEPVPEAQPEEAPN
jgi:hypothetical protein